MTHARDTFSGPGPRPLLLLSARYGSQTLDFACVRLSHERARRLLDRSLDIRRRQEESGIRTTSITKPLVPAWFGRWAEQDPRVREHCGIERLDEGDVHWVTDPPPIRLAFPDARVPEPHGWIDVDEICWSFRDRARTREWTRSAGITELDLVRVLLWTARSQDETRHWLEQLVRRAPRDAVTVCRQGLRLPTTEGGPRRTFEQKTVRAVAPSLLSSSEREARLYGLRLTQEAAHGW